MTNEIMKAIMEAEAQAAEIKQKALDEAAKLIADAEARADVQEQASVAQCKQYRDAEIKKATEEAAEEYKRTLVEKERAAKEYCSAILSASEISVNKIVGRVISGDR